jgi:Tol biopolymer transport system component
MTSPADWARVRALFHAALDLPPDARLAYVRGQASDPRIADEVASLLAVSPAAEGFLDPPVDQRPPLAATAAHLRPGDRLGAFEIVSLIGAGGMGEVYRALDTRLGREVAIKVLSAAFATDGGRERLEREARAVATLTHDRIVTLHDVGSAEIGGSEVTYLVMQLADGETLAARLQRAPLPIGQALSVAIEVAEALVAAHAAGIVHRDLKPANVMLTRSGAKLLDFGLARAKATLAPEAGPPAAVDRDATASALLGTPAYMAPEQLQGVRADARSDLFAFGAMLYEMIAGQRAFSGPSQDALVTAIIEHEPVPLSTLVASVSPALDRLVATCLAKDPDDRWQTARDLLRELRWVRADVANAPAIPATVAGTPSRRRAAWVAMAVGAVVAVAGLWVGLTSSSPAPAPRLSFSVYPPEGTRFPRGAVEMAISPDGTRLVFVALSRDGQRHLWLRRFDATESRPIPGTEEAHAPFWSPDGRSIAFFTHGGLSRIAETGGVTQYLCDVRQGNRGGTWGQGGIILFGAGGQPVMRVPETGGTPEAVTDLAGPWRQHSWPVFLADGRRFLYLAQAYDAATTAIYEGSLDSTDIRRVVAAEAPAGIAGTQVLTFSKGLLTAQPYDERRGRLDGEPITIAEGVTADPPARSGAAFAAADGVVAFRSASPDSRLTWFDRHGVELGAFPGRADYHHPWLSADDTRVAIEKTDPATGRHTIWSLDLLRGTTARVLLDITGAHQPMWAADGRHMFFNSNRLGGVDLYEIEPDTGGDGTLVLSARDTGFVPTDRSPDGQYLLYESNGRESADIFVLPLGTRRPVPYLQTSASETQAKFSPDVRWVAYASNESGSYEVYVRRFPDTGAKWQISTLGGAQPQWRSDGRELFYLGLDGKLMAAPISASPAGIQAAEPRALFDTGIIGSLFERRNHYAVTRDGQRFLVNLSAEDEGSAPITVVVNWRSRRTSSLKTE